MIFTISLIKLSSPLPLAQNVTLLPHPPIYTALLVHRQIDRPQRFPMGQRCYRGISEAIGGEPGCFVDGVVGRQVFLPSEEGLCFFGEETCADGYDGQIIVGVKIGHVYYRLYNS